MTAGARADDLPPVLNDKRSASHFKKGIGYRFSPLTRIYRTEDDLEISATLDSLVLKGMAIVLGRRLNPSRSCYHLLGHGGAKAAVRDVVKNLARQSVGDAV